LCIGQTNIPVQINETDEEAYSTSAFS